MQVRGATALVVLLGRTEVRDNFLILAFSTVRGFHTYHIWESSCMGSFDLVKKFFATVPGDTKSF